MDPEILSGYARHELLDYCTFQPAVVNLLKVDFYAVSLVYRLGAMANPLSRMLETRNR
jgi:hypothetical protein